MENTQIDTIIGINVVLKGNIKNKGSIQINGTVEGEVRSEENVMIGETAHVKGPVSAKTVEVSGTVSGLVEATEKLEVNPMGKIVGDINAKTLVIKQGAVFVGKSTMIQEGVATSGQKPAETATAHSAESNTDKKEEKELVEDKFGFFTKK